jgi:proteic killer suppression protein
MYILRTPRCLIEITFRDPELERAFRNGETARQRFGQRANAFVRRVKQLEAAPSLTALNGTPAACRPVVGTKDGLFAARLSARDQLVFFADHDPLPRLRDGGLDHSRVIQIQIWSVEDVDA